MSKAALQELMAQKKALEKELGDIKEELQLYYSKGFDKSLVDEEGFPRAELDFGELTQYKNLRRTFNEKNNDHMSLMKELEKCTDIQYLGLYNYHATLQNDPNVINEMEEYQAANKAKPAKQVAEVPKVLIQTQQQQQIPQQEMNQEQQLGFVQPFAIITEVTINSPAAQSGLQINDFVLSFGKIDHSNHNNLNSLAAFVKDNVNSKIDVKILRLWNAKELDLNNLDLEKESYIIETLSLIPKQWDGQGVLGCRFKCV